MAEGGEISLGSAVLRLYGDRSALDKEIASAMRDAKRFAQETVAVKLGADTSQASNQIDGLRRQVGSLRVDVDRLNAAMGSMPRGPAGGGAGWQQFGNTMAIVAANASTAATAVMALAAANRSLLATPVAVRDLGAGGGSGGGGRQPPLPLPAAGGSGGGSGGRSGGPPLLPPAASQGGDGGGGQWFASLRQGVERFMPAASQALGVLQQIGVAALGAQTIFYGLGMAINAVIGPMEALAGAAGKFNEQVAEASIFTAQSFAVIGPDGQVIEGTANQMRALRGRVVKEFKAIQKEVAVISGATSSQIYEAFNIILQNNSGLGAAGENISNITKLSTRIAAAMNTLNLPGQQLRTEVGSLLSGDIQMYDQLAQKLYGKGAGEQVRRLQAEGKYYDDLMQKLEKLYDGQKVLALSMTNVKSNFADVFESISTGGGQALERGLARMLQTILTPLNALKGTFMGMLRGLGELLEPIFGHLGQVGSAAISVLSIFSSLLQIIFDFGALFNNAFGSAVMPAMQHLASVLTFVAKSLQLIASLVSAVLRPISTFYRIISLQGQSQAGSSFDNINKTLDSLIANCEKLSITIAKPFVEAAKAAAWLDGKARGLTDTEILNKQKDVQAEFDKSIGDQSDVTLRSIAPSPLARQMDQELAKRYEGLIPEEKRFKISKEIAELKEKQYKNEITALEQGLKLLNAQKSVQQALNELAEGRRGLERKRADFNVSLASSPEAKQLADDRRNELAGRQEQQRINERREALQSERSIQQQQLQISIRQAAIQQEQLKIQVAQLLVEKQKNDLVYTQYYLKARNFAAGSVERQAADKVVKQYQDVGQIIGRQVAAAQRAVGLAFENEGQLRQINGLEQQRLNIQQQGLDIQSQSAQLTLEQQRQLSVLNQKEQAIKNEQEAQAQQQKAIADNQTRTVEQQQLALENMSKLAEVENRRAQLSKAVADANVKAAERLVGLAEAQANAQRNPRSVEAVIGAQIEALALGRTGFVNAAEATKALWDAKERQLKAEQAAANRQLQIQQWREESEERIAMLQLEIQRGGMAAQLLQLKATKELLGLSRTRDGLSGAQVGTAGGRAGMVQPAAGSMFGISPERRALLNTIRYAEGTWANGSDRGYRTMLGGGLMNNLDRHPDKVNSAGGFSSTAAGAYQFLTTTWRSVAQAMGLKQFGPQVQDQGAMQLIKGRGALALADQGRFTPELANKLAPEWASFPTMAGKSFYGQPVKKFGDLKRFYDNQLAQLRGATPQAAAGMPTAPILPAPAGQGGTSLDNSINENIYAMERLEQSFADITSRINTLRDTLMPETRQGRQAQRDAMAVGDAEAQARFDFERRKAAAKDRVLQSPRGQLAAGTTDSLVGGLSGAIRGSFTAAMKGGDVRGAVAEALTSAFDRATATALDALLRPLETMLTKSLFELLSGMNSKLIAEQLVAATQNTGAASVQITAANMNLQAATMAAAGAGGGGGGGIWASLIKGVAGAALGSIGGGVDSLFPSMEDSFLGKFDLPGLTGGDAMSGFVPSIKGFARNGGILTPSGMEALRSYRVGGISNGPNSGYLAELHGREAVIPLPNGKAIDVALKAPLGLDSWEAAGRSSNKSDTSQVLATSLNAMERNQALSTSLNAMEENYQAATSKANPVAVTYERIGSGDLPFVTEEQFRQGVAQSAEEVRRQARREADQQWRKAIRNETRIPGIR
jgi:muramidase (phage lysozyme)